MGRNVQIISTGRYVPEMVLPNAYFDEILGREVDQWLVENVGIRERHVMADTETTSDLALVATQQALERAGIKPEALDLLVVATDTPDFISPATATVLQHKLGAKNAGTYDVNCACAAWVTALDIAARTVITDADVDLVLVVGVYGMSRFVDYTDYKTCTLFADGAGAVLLAAAEKPGFLAGKLTADGSFYDALGIYTGGVSCPTTPINENNGTPRVQFVRKFPATFNSDHWPPLIYSTLAKAKLDIEQVDFFLFTQLNINTIKQTMGILGQPLEKTHWVMDKWGYTGSACIPMALDDALIELNCPKKGDIVLFCASGGGISLACNVWLWSLD